MRCQVSSEPVTKDMRAHGHLDARRSPGLIECLSRPASGHPVPHPVYEQRLPNIRGSLPTAVDEIGFSRSGASAGFEEQGDRVDFVEVLAR